MAPARHSVRDWAELVELVAKTRRGELSLTEGCRSISEVYERICGEPELDSYFQPFCEYDDRTISYPIGSQREHWSRAALEKVDRERIAHEETVRDKIMQDLATLERYARERAI